MKFAQIIKGKITNVFVASKEFGEARGVYCGELPVQIGDSFKDGIFTCTRAEYDEEGNPQEVTTNYDVPAYPEPPTPPAPPKTDVEVLQEKVEALTTENELLFSTIEAILLEMVPDEEE